MMLAHFILVLNCVALYFAGSYSPAYHSFLPAFVQSQQLPYVLPILDYIPQTFDFVHQQETGPKFPKVDKYEERAVIDVVPYHGFVYRTHLGNDAISKVFFHSGSETHRQTQIQKFIASTRNSEDARSNDEKLPSIFAMVDEVFGNQPVEFQYIYNSNELASVPKGRSLNEKVPLNQLFGNHSRKDAPTDKPPTESAKKSTTPKEVQIKNSNTTTLASTTPSESYSN